MAKCSCFNDYGLLYSRRKKMSSVRGIGLAGALSLYSAVPPSLFSHPAKSWDKLSFRLLAHCSRPRAGRNRWQFVERRSSHAAHNIPPFRLSTREHLAQPLLRDISRAYIESKDAGTAFPMYRKSEGALSSYISPQFSRSRVLCAL